MHGKSKIATLAAAAAMTGLIGGASMTLVGCNKDSGGTNASKASPSHACKGMNACKGLGGCKTGDGGCAGKNSCKGKGGCKVS